MWGSPWMIAVHGEVHDDRLEDMICDVGVESFAEVHGYGSMSSDAETSLYPGSTNFTQLSHWCRNIKQVRLFRIYKCDFITAFD